MTQPRLAPPRREPLGSPGEPARRKTLSLRAKVLIALGGVIVLAALLGLLPNEPIRRSIESRMNRSLKGYRASIGRARLQPIGLSLTLENLVIRQTAHPDPPVLTLPLLHASVRWRELLVLKLVADFRLDRPKIDANLPQLRQETSNPTPVRQRGWQQAVEAIYPLRIDHLVVHDASITYVDRDQRKPLEITTLDVEASNIRNIDSREHAYPSPVRASAVVFGTGRVTLEGHADFLAEPYAGVHGIFRLTKIPLAALGPVGEHWNLLVSGGELSADGEIEYAPNARSLRMPSIELDRVIVGYVRGAPAAPKPSSPPGPAPSETPRWSLALDRFHATDSRLELVDHTKKTPYRVFVSHVRADVGGLANQPPGNVAHAVVKGKFMDDGDMTASATFQPGRRNGNLDVQVEIGPTAMTRLNDLFRAYGKFDVAAGTLQVFSEMGVHDHFVRGYVKPIFRGVEISDPSQKADKGLFQKIYEGAVAMASEVLKNRKHDQIATNATIEGPIGNAHSSLFEVLGGLLENAFVRAILPGFDREVGVRRPG
jgi:Domain of Unknown Function (DUF748)